jgi:hypothetical protein
MKIAILPLLYTLLVPVSAQDDTICVKYTKAVFGEDNAENELSLITAVVNLAVLGNVTLGVDGILSDEGGLAPFFTGAGNTTNRGDTAVSINFLDGAADLPNPSTSSYTYILLSHLYQFFGGLLGCNAEEFPVYQGDPDMYRVHKFMDLDEDQMDFFITQVALAGTALGVTEDDIAVIGSVLDGLFNMRCTPTLTADDGVPSFLVGTNPSMCQALSCPVADATACPDANGTSAGSSVPTSAPFENNAQTSDAAVITTWIAVAMTGVAVSFMLL